MSHHVSSQTENIADLLAQARVIDIREAGERIGNPGWIQQLDHMPMAAWMEITGQFPDRPLVLACAGGIRTQKCVELLGFPDGVYAWLEPIQTLAPFLTK